MEKRPLKTLLIGFGNQGETWALNLRDSGIEVDVALRPNSKSVLNVVEKKFSLILLQKNNTHLLVRYDVVLMLIPDGEHLPFLNKWGKNFKGGVRFIYAHGYSYYEKREDLKKVSPEKAVHLLLALKGIAGELREIYLRQMSGEKKGAGMSAVFSIEDSEGSEEEKNQDKEMILTFAKNLGVNLGPFETSFKMECEADLFSEQSLLCSLIPYGAKLSFDLLVKKGVDPELAYLECWYELKLIVDTLIKVGPKDFYKLISPNALIGSDRGEKLLFGDGEIEKKFEELWDNIALKRFSKSIQSESSDSVDSLRKKIESNWDKSLLPKIHDKLKGILY